MEAHFCKKKEKRKKMSELWLNEFFFYFSLFFPFLRWKKIVVIFLRYFLIIVTKIFFFFLIFFLFFVGVCFENSETDSAQSLCFIRFYYKTSVQQNKNTQNNIFFKRQSESTDFLLVFPFFKVYFKLYLRGIEVIGRRHRNGSERHSDLYRWRGEQQFVRLWGRERSGFLLFLLNSSSW